MSDRGRSSGTGGDSSPRTSDTGSYRHAGYRRKHNRDRDKTPMPQSGAGPHRSPQTPRRSPQTKYDRMSPYPPRSRAGTQRREFLRERSPERRPKTEAHQADEGPQASSSSNPIGRPVIPSESSRAPPPSLRAQQVPPQMGRQLSADSEISIDTDVGEGHTPPITERCLRQNHHCMAEIRSLDQGNGVVHCLTDDSGVDSWEMARNKYTHRSELVTFGTEDPRISRYQLTILLRAGVFYMRTGSSTAKTYFTSTNGEWTELFPSPHYIKLEDNTQISFGSHSDFGNPHQYNFKKLK